MALIPNPTESGSRYNSTMRSLSWEPPPPPIILVRDGFLIFLAGVGIIACLLVVAHLVLLLSRRLRRWWRSRRRQNSFLSPSDVALWERQLEQQLALELRLPGSLGDPIVREAGLVGLTKDERKLLLQHILQPVPFSDAPSPSPSSSEAPEAKGLASSPKRQISGNTPETPQVCKILVDRLPLTPTRGVTEIDTGSAESNQSNSSSRGIGNLVSTPPKVDVEEGVREEGSKDREGVASNPNRRRSRMPSWRTSLSGGVTSRQKSTSSASQLEGLDESVSAGGLGDDYLHTCCICLSRYEAGVSLLPSRHCPHRFHYDCCMEWLDQHDVCPYCRSPMFTADELQEAAWDALDRLRVIELRHNWGEYEKRLAAARRTIEDPPPDHPGIIAQLYRR